VTGTAIRTAAAIAVSALATAARVLSVQYVARALGVPQRTLRYQCEAGKIDGAYQLGAGSPWNIPIKWLDEQREKRGKAVIRRPAPIRGNGGR
jgi:hypothetical protein